MEVRKKYLQNMRIKTNAARPNIEKTYTKNAHVQSTPAHDATLQGLQAKSAFMKDDGFTSAGVAIALLLVAALIFASLHAFWIGSHSGEIQYVADAGALAADAVVADYISAGQVVDASLLSLSLLSLSIYAISAVASFIPGGQGVALKIANFASKIVKARKSFAKTAQKCLNALQDALPLLCAARATECIQANSNASGIAYKGSAIALPLKGTEIKLAKSEKLEEAGENIESKEDEIQDNSSAYKQAQEEMDSAKKKAWIADCGGNNMSMRERAEHLAQLDAAKNPHYASVSNWTFSVGLERAKAYYEARYVQEPGSSFQGNPELVAESVARKRFYKYAQKTVSSSYISKQNGLEVPKLKYLARNTDGIKKTELYTEAIYPVSKNDNKKYLHACTSCPKYQKGQDCGLASVASIDSGENSKCTLCKFSATTLGRVPSASTSIDNGFEYYYKQFVDAANEYAAATTTASETKEELDKAKDEISNEIKEAAKEAFGTRYDPQPPGRYGCICIVAGTGALSQNSNSFFNSGQSGKVRLAISGATLAADTDVDEADVLSSIGANLFPANTLSSGISKRVFRYWSKMLKVYANGTKEIETIFNEVLGIIPIVGNELSAQAVDSFRSALTSCGMQPANLYAYKPVLINTNVILKRDSSAVSQTILSIKNTASSYEEVKRVWDYIQDDFSQLSWSDKGIVVGKIALGYFGFGIGESEIILPFSKECLQLFKEAK